ncbi:MAG: tRNA pseudouridine(55) synthase TruB [Bacilli bacterium]|nr:tRNA pseudouridine(55) synthase TruB [Bacilli bacterium]
MNEILILDKPSNYTSRDLVNIVGKKFKTKKVGHTGTLDPLATGVLVVLIGKYTTLSEVITGFDKTYEAEVELGLLTDTLDITGNVLKTEEAEFQEAEIREVLNSMLGSYEQEVPIYSAVKINGKKLYEYARNNEEVDLPKRKVDIKEISLLGTIKIENGHTIFKFKTTVSKGTYIRALINDIALKLNTNGTMISLRRIKQGNFTIKDAITLDDLNNDKYEFFDINKCFSDNLKIEVDETLLFKIKNGQSLKNIYNSKEVVFTYQNNIIAIYKDGKNTLKMWKYLL